MAEQYSPQAGQFWPAADTGQAAPAVHASPTHASGTAHGTPGTASQSFSPQAPQQPAPSQTASAPTTGQVPQRTSFGMAAGAVAGATRQGPGSAPATPTNPAAVPAQAPAQTKSTSTEAPQRIGMSRQQEAGDLDVQAALRAMLAAGASDLHITSGAPPMMRVDGGLVPVEGMTKQTPEGIQRALYGLLTQKQRETFEEHLELDFSYALVGEARYRVNIYQQRNAIGAAFRVIPYEIKALEALGVPATVSNFAGLPRGLVLVTGPTGSGKSTTLASLIDLVNRNRASHIMTVEDPIEFLHRHKRSLVNQREVGADTHSFKNALKHVLRQDPDVILIGELRDLETIQVALTAAETGHLVFGTLHTQDAAQTISRIIDVFPSEQQAQVQTQLGAALQGVVCQALLRRSDGPGRAVATEVMVATPAIRNLIREGKTHQIYSMLQAGSRQGMHTMDQHLAQLVKMGRISYESGVEMCHHYEDYNRLCGRGTAGGGA